MLLLTSLLKAKHIETQIVHVCWVQLTSIALNPRAPVFFSRAWDAIIFKASGVI